MHHMVIKVIISWIPNVHYLLFINDYCKKKSCALGSYPLHEKLSHPWDLVYVECRQVEMVILICQSSTLQKPKVTARCTINVLTIFLENIHCHHWLNITLLGDALFT